MGQLSEEKIFGKIDNHYMFVLSENVIVPPGEQIFAVLCKRYLVLTMKFPINVNSMFSKGDDFNSTSVSNFLTSQILES